MAQCAAPTTGRSNPFIGTDGSRPCDRMGDDGLALFPEQGDELFLLGHQGVDLCGFRGQKRRSPFVHQGLMANLGKALRLMRHGGATSRMLFAFELNSNAR